MHALVNHGLRTVDLQAPHIKPERHPGAVAAIKEIQRALRSQLPALDARADETLRMVVKAWTREAGDPDFGSSA